MKNVIPFLLCSLLLQSCDSQTKKINAISFVASREQVNQEHLDPIVKLNANYAAVMPFGFIRDLASPEVLFNTDRQWFGERKEGVTQYVEQLHANGIAVMMKPQIWIRRGEFTGYLKMTTEEDWKVFEESYQDFILTFAEVAAETDVALFCIGTELEQFIIERPQFWNTLIAEIKKVYKGKLTYAANWDEYKRVPFWEQLDYIGVDAYFPVSESKTPTVAEARQGWQPWKKELKEVSEENNRPILFTEYGYRSVDFSGKEPWKSEREMPGLNLEAQTNLTKAIFEEMYPENWFAGGFIWKWFINHKEAGGMENHMFTPQNKPVEDIIRQHFKETR
ncbi:glycoside hydrolase [Jejudonia soesokkakensis]|uniref:Glycoside hydrolase n=1 Tax=Jejudonia soesokkakensis TaxID=1323432 RepID=A0ABW2MV17_9FLAO